MVKKDVSIKLSAANIVRLFEIAVRFLAYAKRRSEAL